MVRNKKCPSLRNVIRGVQLLLTITDGKRNIHAGQSECGHFGNRTRTRATHNQISNGKRIFHCGEVVNDVPTISNTSCLHRIADLLILPLAGEVDNLHPFGQLSGDFHHRTVHIESPQGAAGDEQGLHIGVDPQLRGRGASRRFTSFFGGTSGGKSLDGGTQRKTSHHSYSVFRLQRSRGESQSQGRCPARTDSVSESRTGVLLMDDDGKIHLSRGKICGSRNISAETNERICSTQG